MSYLLFISLSKFNKLILNSFNTLVLHISHGNRLYQNFYKLFIFITNLNLFYFIYLVNDCFFCLKFYHI